jgi:PAS domain S-box-containing protein
MDRNYETFVHPVFDKEGNVAEVAVLGFDITERKQTEEALRSSEEKYRTILENIEEGYYEVDIAGNFTFLNESMCRIYGYPKEELMGMNDRQYTDKENAKRLFETFNKVYRTGEPQIGYDYAIIRKIAKDTSRHLYCYKRFISKPLGLRDYTILPTANWRRKAYKEENARHWLKKMRSWQRLAGLSARL